MSKKEPNVNDKIVGGNIRRLRHLRKMSQGALGGALRLTFQQVQKYEKGTNRVGASRMVQIASIFNCPVMELFVGVVDPKTERSLSKTPIKDPVKELGLTTRGLRVASLFIRAPLAAQQNVIDLLETIITTGEQANGSRSGPAARSERTAVRV